MQVECLNNMVRFVSRNAKLYAYPFLSEYYHRQNVPNLTIVSIHLERESLEPQKANKH
jgi:hypothetical protein